MKTNPNFKFQNWAKTYSCQPSDTVVAHTEQDVLDAISYSNSKKLKIRVVGSGHSPSDIACTPDLMLDMSPLNSIISIDTLEKKVTVQAGIKVWQVNQLLDERGWALPNLGSISDQSISGLISTGSHGTGVGFGCLGTCVTHLRLITSTGQTLDLNGGDEFFNAAVCSLGCLGVIVQVTLQAVDAFQIHAIQSPLKFDDMISHFDEGAESADHVRYWWFPNTEDCVIWRGTRTLDPPKPCPEKWIKNTLLGVHGFETALYASRYIPSLVPKINKTYFELFFNKETQVLDKSFRVFNFDCLFSQYVTEWAVDRKKAPEALIRLKQFLTDHPDIVAHSPVEIRFVKADDFHLSMSYGVDTCFIGIIIYRYSRFNTSPFGKEVPFKEYWKGYEDIMNDLGGRPHWAKAHSLTPSQLKMRYPKLVEFLNIRKRLDPIDMFTNDYIRRHLLSDTPTPLVSKL